uniref:RNA polymerase Rpb7-like N-terminal domain-containing protein n=1 Tax=viral metagenome TaxID=1070528 RepID=A0A6C0IEC2_9ZZZZ
MSIQKNAILQKINLRFCLAPEYFDADYKDHLLNSIREKYENKSFKEYGYILEIQEIERILNEEIMSMVPNVFFMVQVRALLYLPRVGDRLEVQIDKIFHHGIFIMENKIRILIPIALSTEYEVQKDFSSFYLLNTQTHKTYRKDDRLHVELVEVRFEKDGFSCIASIVSSVEV